LSIIYCISTFENFKKLNFKKNKFLLICTKILSIRTTTITNSSLFNLFMTAVVRILDKLRFDKIQNQFWIVLFCVGALSSCLEPYPVDNKQETERLVVEALLTNDSQMPAVRLSFTSQSESFSNTVPVRGALVVVKDNKGLTMLFKPLPTLPGLYEPNDRNYRGEPGKTYRLSIKLTDGRTYESSPETMPAVVGVEKITANFENPVTEGRLGEVGFRVTLDVKDPKNIENYYRWTSWGLYKRKSTGVPVGFGGGICCDVCWVRKDENGINTLSDANADGGLLANRTVYFSPFYYYGRNYVEVRQLAITRGAFQFWRRYIDQLSRSGSIFDPIPAPVLGNIINTADGGDVAIGYFEVASATTKRIVIEGDALIGKINYPREFILNGDCSVAVPYAVYDTFAPPGW
jgi:Domain of unknown function (DUF4249)